MTVQKLIFILIVFLCSANASSQDENGEAFEIDDIDIQYTDTESFSSEIIQGIMSLKKGDYFDYEIFRQDVERVKKFYFDNGFFDVSVDTTVFYKPKGKEIIEGFLITEGNRYTLQEIDLYGLSDIPKEVYEKITDPNARKIMKGSYYSKDTINQEVLRITGILLDHGYALAVSESPEVLKYESNEPDLRNKAFLALSFKTGDVYRFGKTSVTFRGKTYNVTKGDITRELSYREGALYSKLEITNSELNLSKMSILENPRIEVADIDSANRIINLKLDILVNNKYELTPEVFGYYFDNFFYLGTGVSFFDKNFFGGGRVLSTSARVYYNSTKNYRFEIENSIFQPFLFNNRNISGNWNVGVQYISEEVAYTTSLKNTFSIGFDLPRYTYINRLIASWDTDFDNVTLREDVTSTDSTLIRSFSFNSVFSTLNFTALHNSVNNPQFPFSGFFQSYSIEESGLLSKLLKNFINAYSSSYLKFTNQNSFYFNLSDRQTKVPLALATKFYWGTIFEYGENQFTFGDEVIDAERVPTDEKFVCGGSSSIRGWGGKQLGIVVDKDVGGNFIIETSAELRMRPFLDLDNIYIRDFGFAAFVDIGNVWSEISKLKINELAFAAGGGLRYYTIVGAIRFDIGFKVYDPQPGPVGGAKWIFGKGANFSDKYNFQIGIGNTF